MKPGSGEAIDGPTQRQSAANERQVEGDADVGARGCAVRESEHVRAQVERAALGVRTTRQVAHGAGQRPRAVQRPLRSEQHLHPLDVAEPEVDVDRHVAEVGGDARVTGPGPVQRVGVQPAHDEHVAAPSALVHHRETGCPLGELRRVLQVAAFDVRAAESRDAHRHHRHIPQRLLGSRCGHDQRVAEAGERQRDERHLHRAGRDDDAVDGGRLETAQPGAEPVGARPQAGEHEAARTVRHRRPWVRPGPPNNVTATPGSTAPVASATRPTIRPDCAPAGAGDSAIRTRTSKTGRTLVGPVLTLAKQRDENVVRLCVVPLGELPDGHPGGVDDEFGNVETRDRCENVEGNTVHSLDDQLLGVARVQERRRRNQADAHRPRERKDKEGGTLGEVVAERPPVAEHMEGDGGGEADPDEFVCELEGPLRYEEHEQPGNLDEDARAHRQRSLPSAGVEVPHHRPQSVVSRAGNLTCRPDALRVTCERLMGARCAIRRIRQPQRERGSFGSGTSVDRPSAAAARFSPVVETVRTGQQHQPRSRRDHHLRSVSGGHVRAQGEKQVGRRTPRTRDSSGRVTCR